MSTMSILPLTRPPQSLLSAVRTFTRSSSPRNASQPATPSPTPNPHATRSASSSGDARSRLAKLQAQRLEELNRGRKPSGGTPPKKPEQKWSNRTLIALATSVGACTYLMGTYHGYNAGKAHAVEELQLQSGGGGPVVEGTTAVGVVDPSRSVGGRAVPGATASLQTSVGTGSLSTALTQLLPFGLKGAVQCEPQHPKCRLAELTQYHCDLHTNRVVCQPIDRIFRICKGRPAVEVSHIVEYDDAGKPYLPAHLSEAMPPSSHWHELRSPDL